jgi:tRNA threonylcarbamoyladenosine biosynthesis protein TsaE
VFVLKSEISCLEDLEAFAGRLAGNLSKGDVVFLNGEMGAGKTTLTHYIGEALGIRDQIISPTFTIGKKYSGPLPITHIDVYRLMDTGSTPQQIVWDLEENGLFDDLESSVTIIEWGESLVSAIPKGYRKIWTVRIDREPQTETRIIEVIEND